MEGMEMCNYQNHMLPINLGTSLLTNESAYFLGGLIAADEFIIHQGVRYCISPVRYNREYPTQQELSSHFTHVNSIAALLNNRSYKVTGNCINSSIIIPKFNNRRCGFVTLFPESQEITIEEIANLIETALANSSEEVTRCFIAGIFDGRGAIDFNTYDNSIRYISLDCNNIEVVRTFRRILNNFEINYNTSRDRLEGGEPRANQLRISNIGYYYHNIGFISDAKFNKYLLGNTGVNVNHESNILPGLKTIQYR